MSMVEELRIVALQVEQAKLKAIGQRNLVQNVIEGRQQKKLEMEKQIKEKRAELARRRAEYLSLQKVEAEQLALIDKIQEN